MKLTPKQQAVVEIAVNDVAEGRGLDLTEATRKIYNVNGKRSAQAISGKNLTRKHFRQALMNGLTKRNIIGENSRVEVVLDQGLDAEFKGRPDHKTRLEYVKEINKISGVYAAEKRETKSMNLNIDMSQEELEERIKNLNKELNEP